MIETGPEETSKSPETGRLTIPELAEAAKARLDALEALLHSARTRRDHLNEHIRALVDERDDALRAVRALTPRKRAAK